MTSRELHERIRRRVEAHVGIRSIRTLARDADLPYSTLHRQISEARFTIDVLWALAECFGVSLCDLVPSGPGRRAVSDPPSDT